MKNIFILFLFIVGISFYSCDKQEINNPADNKIEQSENALTKLQAKTDNSNMAISILDDFSCEPTIDPNECVIEYTTTGAYDGVIVDGIDDCPGGSVQINYDITYCYDAIGNLISFHIFNSSAVLPQNIVDCLAGLPTNDWQEVYDAYEYASLVALEKLLLQRHMPKNILCPTDNFQTSFARGICYRVCQTGEVGSFLLTKELCGQVCCERVTNYCILDGKIVTGNSGFYLIGDGECENNPVGSFCEGEKSSCGEHPCEARISPPDDEDEY